MKLEIREIENLTGAKARVYSVILDGEENTLLEQFFDENVKYTHDLKKVLYKIYVMAQNTGCRKSYFKEGEGAWADGMVALQGTGCPANESCSQRNIPNDYRERIEST